MIKETLEWYQTQTMKTCADLKNYKLDLCHMALGMHTEYSEFIAAMMKGDDINVGEELADMCWYISNYCNFRKISLVSLFSNDCIPYDHMTEVTAEIQDLIKKYIAYNKPIDEKREQILLSNLLCIIDHTFKNSSLNMETALKNNIDKLKIRFPDKFNEQNAIERNEELERKELEK